VDGPPRARTPRNVLALGAVSLLTDASSEMVYWTLPLFLTQVLGAPVSVVGVIESVAESTASLTKVASGWLSDRVGRRKPLVVAGYTLSNLAKPLLAMAAGWPTVLALRFADRLGKGVRTAPRDALIADSSEAARRGRAFGVHRALDTFGAAVGPLIAWGVLSLRPGSFTTIFWISAVPGVLAIAVAVFLVREVRSRDRRDASRGELPHFRGLGRPLAVFTAISAVFALGNSSDAMLMLRAADLGAPTALIPLMGAGFSLVGAALAVPAGVLSDRFGRRVVLVTGFALYALVYAGFGVGGSTWTAAALFLAYGIPYAMVEALSRAYVVDLVGPDRRATAVGAYTFVLGLAAIPASAVAGILWDTVSHGTPFLVSAALMAIAAVALWVAPTLRKVSRRPLSSGVQESSGARGM
jgi:MFS family permease